MTGMNGSPLGPSIGILVVAYNAAETLSRTLDRIPEDFRPRISEIIIADDASKDETFRVGADWARSNPTVKTTVQRRTKNLGYGGNQKAGYQLAIEHGLDIVVMLHGDGQYAPEYLPQMVEPIVRGEADAVFGSRMMAEGGARKGGMPLYKYVGNKILTRLENGMLGTGLTEFHSGYRAYSTKALCEVPFEYNTDAFDFDTQIIVQLVHAQKRIVEIPIPTFYGDEICNVDGLKYAKDVVKDVIEYRLVNKGFGSADWVPKAHERSFQAGDGSNRAALMAMLDQLPPNSRILDLECADGTFAARARELGHTVVGVAFVELPGVRETVDRFHQADLEFGIPAEVGDGYDLVVIADVLEQLARPSRLMRDIWTVLKPGGQVLLSVPNFGHWYPRLKVATGRFGYDRRGILDETHLRFFTRRTLRRLVVETGFDLLEERQTGLPFTALFQRPRRRRVMRAMDNGLARLRPSLFAYQLVMRLTPHYEDTVQAETTEPAAESAEKPTSGPDASSSAPMSHSHES
jgi:glycosyltransferase involved in cell wall biosynthesis